MTPSETQPLLKRGRVGPKRDSEKPTEPTKVPAKLSTFSGVFLPTALNVLSILMFLRFGFIVGQLGLLGAIATLALCYTINLLTTLSVSAIATNGIVRTGGAYYMISRSLGPEFGGAIGLIFFFGQILNSALNVVGLIEPLLYNFGATSGKLAALLPESYWWSNFYSSVILFVCFTVSLVGADLVSKAAQFLFVILMLSITSIPISALFKSSFEIPSLDTFYSGLSWSTFVGNLLPHFTKHAAGSQISGKETFANLFGIFFPATAGILAGASMSGSLKNPSRSIPKGTLWGLLVTFSCYSVVIVSISACIPRDLLHKDVQVLQTVSLAQSIVLAGELSTSLFSIIMGLVGAAEILTAIAKDEIFPGLSIFKKGFGTIIFSWALIQAFLFSDINQIATLITMAFLMTFIVINIACFLLEISAAPNFRPSFAYFNRATAGSGVISCIIAMFIVDGLSASMIVLCLLFLIIFIHYSCPPKSWGDVSQTLIYHQVRKYLFKLRQDNVKYWRPQILLLVDNPRTCWNLMHFCNHLKKGGLYILGHVIINNANFQDCYDDYVKERAAWIGLRDTLNLKAFVQFSLSSSLVSGVRNIFLGSGLGSMKPNIVVIGFVDLSENRTPGSAASQGQSTQLQSSSIQSLAGTETLRSDFIPKSIEKLNPEYYHQVRQRIDLPTDSCSSDTSFHASEWVQCIEELLLMKVNVAVAKGFPRLAMPEKNSEELSDDEKEIIDLYPIQMAAEIAEKSGQTLLSTNFDTYTLILQLGAILTTVPQWNKTHKLRIVVFVEELSDVAEEKQRVLELIRVLRITAEVKVLCFNSGNYSFYDYIVKDRCLDKKVAKKINKVLANNEWWKTVCALRSEQENVNKDALTFERSPTQLNKDLGINHNVALSKLQRLGVKFRMRTNKLFKDPVFESDSDEESGYSASESETGFESDPETSIRKHKTLAMERRRVRRKTFATTTATRYVSTPKSPFLEVRSSAAGVPPMNLDDDSDTNSISEQTTAAGAASSTALKRPSLSRQSSRQSYNSLRNHARPNFSSQAMPKSKVNEDAEGNEPTIMFEDTGSIKSKSSKKERKATESGAKSADNGSVYSSEPLSGSSDDEDYNVHNLTFNDLPARVQHLILNQLMMKTSKNSSIIFSTLPTPPVGCYKNNKECLEYVETLDLWCRGLPPILLINSRTMTVTTAL